MREDETCTDRSNSVTNETAATNRKPPYADHMKVLGESGIPVFSLGDDDDPDFNGSVG